MDEGLRPLKWYNALATPAGREAEGAFLVEGPRAIGQVLAVCPAAVRELLVSEGAPAPTGLLVPVRQLSYRQMDSVSPSRTPQGLLAVVAMPVGSSSDSLPVETSGHVLLCEHVQDPGNVGTLIRSAAAFGFAGVVLSDEAADPFGPKAVQASAGAVVSVWVRRTAGYLKLVDELKAGGYRLAAADLAGDPSSSWTRGVAPTLLALGSEGRGLSREVLQRADVRFKIAIESGRVESLNVAAAGAIAMYCLAAHRSR
jgi:RNA methyltransferase, TrmH family